MAQNKDYRHKGGVSLVTNIAQNIQGKSCDGQPGFGICRIFHFFQWYTVEKLTYFALHLLHCCLTLHFFCTQDHHRWHKATRKVNLCCQYSLCLCLRFFRSSSQVFTMTPVCASAPTDAEQVLQSCKKLNFTWPLPDKATGTTEARQQFVCWLKNSVTCLQKSRSLSC